MDTSAPTTDPTITGSLTQDQVMTIIDNELLNWNQISRMYKGSIQSGNYVLNSKGWKLDALGNSEFNSFGSVSNTVSVTVVNGVTTFSVANPFIPPGQWASVLDNIGNSGASPNVDFSKGQRHIMTLNAATVSPTFLNFNSGAVHNLILKQDGTGGRLVSWPTIKWMNSISPLLSTAASAIDIISLLYDGTNIYGTYSLNFG